MHTPEALILRRCYPVPVTFADLRAAFYSMREYEVAVSIRHLDHIAKTWTWGGTEAQYMPIRKEMAELAAKTRCDFSVALREVTGALDEVYAVVDGREVRVALVKQGDNGSSVFVRDLAAAGRASENNVHDLLDKADREGYWERPHEVRLDLQTRTISRDEVAKAVMVGQLHAERLGQ